MKKVIRIYNSTVRDDVNESENGYYSIQMFNRNLERAELNLMKYITGDLIPSADFPMPYNTQKNKDYLKRFIVKFKANNSFTIPEDYYGWENLYKLGSYKSSDCDTDETVEVKSCNTPISILDGQAFYSRCNSYIEGLKPTQGVPIAKIVDNTVEIEPSDVGSVCLEYIRYPKYGKIVTKVDKEYNDEVPDEENSVDLEWDEWAIEPLIWFLSNKFFTHTREMGAIQINMANKPRG